MGAQYFSLKVAEKQVENKIMEVIDFSMDFMGARTYRQIVSKAKHHFPKLLGFQSVCIFFENKGEKEDDLFTVADNEQPTVFKDDLAYDDTTFALDLCFPDDQILVFPSFMGITGEVHHKKSIKVENEFGVLV